MIIVSFGKNTNILCFIFQDMDLPERLLVMEEEQLFLFHKKTKLPFPRSNLGMSLSDERGKGSGDRP
jgi:hypothetical protein